jgi:hypothetical protein
MPQPNPTPSWIDRQEALLRLARRQLFFVGGAPRSGTTWLQHVLDSHPAVSCRGEALFQMALADKLQAAMNERRRVIEEKNTRLFRHSGGYPLPGAEDVEALVGTGIMMALARQSAGRDCQALGEKTPENVFTFPMLKRLFPTAKFIGMARDPRDVLASAWHFFHQPGPDGGDAAAKLKFVRDACPQLHEGARRMLALRETFPADSMIVTYETMLAEPARIAGELFRFLGVAVSDEIVADTVRRTSFSALAGGRAAGAEQSGVFFRKGVAGDWHTTLDSETGALIVRELGWMFPKFGWRV